MSSWPGPGAGVGGQERIAGVTGVVTDAWSVEVGDSADPARQRHPGHIIEKLHQVFADVAGVVLVLRICDVATVPLGGRAVIVRSIAVDYPLRFDFEFAHGSQVAIHAGPLRRREAIRHPFDVVRQKIEHAESLSRHEHRVAIIIGQAVAEVLGDRRQRVGDDRVGLFRPVGRGVRDLARAKTIGIAQVDRSATSVGGQVPGHLAIDGDASGVIKIVGVAVPAFTLPYTQQCLMAAVILAIVRVVRVLDNGDVVTHVIEREVGDLPFQRVAAIRELMRHSIVESGDHKHATVAVAPIHGAGEPARDRREQHAARREPHQL